MDWIVDLPVECPWCGETFTVAVDTSQGDGEMVQDCEVCCRPYQLNVRCRPGEIESVDVGAT